MKKIFAFLFLVGLTGCDDGDFEIPSFQFNETVQQCGSYIVYRTNAGNTEAFVLVLNTSVIKNEVSTEPLTLAITPQNTQYRIFDGPINSQYFCQILPPTAPIVLKQWEGVSGASSIITIETTEEKNTNGVLTGYKHKITLSRMRLEYQEESITYQTYIFGSFTTPL